MDIYKLIGELLQFTFKSVVQDKGAVRLQRISSANEQRIAKPTVRTTFLTYEYNWVERTSSQQVHSVRLAYAYRSSSVHIPFLCICITNIDVLLTNEGSVVRALWAYVQRMVCVQSVHNSAEIWRQSKLSYTG